MDVALVRILIWVGAAIIIGLDIWFATDSIRGNTWSEIIQKWSQTFMVVPFIFGAVSGHWFKPWVGLDYGIWIVLGVLVVVGILDIFYDAPAMIVFTFALLLGFVWR